MKIAFVTGTSSGIGLSIARKLLKLNYRVHGFARDHKDNHDFKHQDYFPITCDITQTDKLLTKIKEILKKEKRLDVLVNNAGIGNFGPHETMDSEHLSSMVNTNLLAPLIITQETLRFLKTNNGFVINIASTAATEVNKYGAAYSATKAGLLHFGRCLFAEVRKSGVKVVTISPDLTTTDFHKNASFEPGDDADCHLEPECIANAVEQVLTQRTGTVVNELVIRPQRLQLKKK
jgi:short-subunit dehydrogenase